MTNTKEEADKVLKKYPKSIPILIDTKYDTTPKLKKNKYIIPNSFTFGHFFEIIRKQLDIKKETALFFFINKNILLSAGMLISDIYNKYKSENGFLQVYYSLENVFG